MLTQGQHVTPKRSLYFLYVHSQDIQRTIFVLLSCPQIVTARIMTSRLCGLGRAISKKKAKAYYYLYSTFFIYTNTILTLIFLIR